MRVSDYPIKSTYDPSFRLDEGTVGAVHLVVEAARVAQVVAVAVAPPQRGRSRAAVDAFASV
jgi:N-acetylglutamate synthase-like GNAT family acetyltransferase